jgi:hypothetical protein
MEAELKRAMASLGNSDSGDPDKAAPKPYFLSYAVSDATNIDISAQYGAITSSNGSHRRSADVQVRLGRPTTAPHLPEACGSPPTAATRRPSTAI